MTELLLRFLIGGLVVSSFAAVGDIVQPKSFAGLFGAAPSVALATLALTISKDGRMYSALEARSMLAGAAALWVYAQSVRWLLKHCGVRALKATLIALPLWFGTAFICGFAFFR